MNKTTINALKTISLVAGGYLAITELGTYGFLALLLIVVPISMNLADVERKLLEDEDKLQEKLNDLEIKLTQKMGRALTSLEEDLTDKTPK